MKRSFLFIGFLCVFLLSCVLFFQKSERFNGVNWVGTNEVLEQSAFNSLDKIKANSVAIIPFAYGNTTTGELTLEMDWQWWGESIEGSKELARMAKANGLKVMIKPQIWFDHGTFTGDVAFKEEAAWQKLEKGYKTYILEHAKNAESVKADILCIGTELKKFVSERSTFWNELITEVKAIYKGKLTYAGNWDSYSTFPFWEKMDYIGVDAYFPLTDSEQPEVKEIKEGWQKHITQLRGNFNEFGKKILFCEYGFRSKPKNADKPWESGRTNEVDLTAQLNAYQGTFESVWKEDFLAGGFLWKWYPDHIDCGGNNCNRFTPQNKPTQELIKKYYSE